MSTYTAVGITEEWNLTMDLFNARVKSPVREWREQELYNAGATSEVREQLLAWAQHSPEIQTALAADLLLYDFSLSLFKQQTTESLGTVWHDSENGGRAE